MRDGPAADGVTKLLTPFVNTLPPDTIDGYRFPISDGSERNRKNMRRAVTLLDQAGYRVVDGKLTDPAGDPVSFKILLRQGAQEYLSIVELYMDALSRLGISVEVDLVDGAQYAERRKALDFDMTPFARSLSLSPGNEQRLYWGQEYADVEGTRNLMGLNSPAMDALIDALNTAKTRQQFLDAVRAMDRVLTAGRYVIPIYHNGPSRIAHKSYLKFPSDTPIYGDRIGFFPDTWWSEE
jgi:peptide/nickel transport system substrate-binding protein